MVNTVTPGVYVVEVPSGLAPIAGASTNTVGFVGFLPGSTTVTIPIARKGYDSQKKTGPNSSIALKDKNNQDRDANEVISELTGQQLKNVIEIPITTSILKQGTEITDAVINFFKELKPSQTGDNFKQINLTKKLTDFQAQLPAGVTTSPDAANVSVKKTVKLTSTTADTEIEALKDWILDQDIDLGDKTTITVKIPTTRSLSAAEAQAVYKHYKDDPSLGNAIDIQGNLPYQGVPVSLKATADTPKLCTSFSEFKQFQ